MTTEPLDIDLGTLAFIVGSGFNDAVTARLHAAGFTEVRQVFGYVVQHLISGPKSATDLAALLGISQQAASKRIQEMLDCALLVEVDSADARRRTVALSPRGKRMLATARALREELSAEMMAGVAAKDVTLVRRVLAGAVERLGMGEALRGRKIKEP